MKYAKGKISIPNVTGNVTITVHSSPLPPPENLSKPSEWVTGRRIDQSGTIQNGSLAYLCNAIPVVSGDVIRMKNCGTLTDCFPTVFASDSTDIGTAGTRMNITQESGVFTVTITANGYFRQPMLISELDTDALKNAVVITKNEALS